MASLHFLYLDLEQMAAWKDFLHRIHQVKIGLVENLVSGSGLDTNGVDHSNEIRLTLHAINTILYYVPSLHRDFEENEKRSAQARQQQQRRLQVV